MKKTTPKKKTLQKKTSKNTTTQNQVIKEITLNQKHEETQNPLRKNLKPIARKKHLQIKKRKKKHCKKQTNT